MKSKTYFLVLSSAILLFLLVSISDSPRISANVAAPSQGGRIAGEPLGLELIKVKNRSLTIDFRPLAEAAAQKRVLVEIIYEIENADAEKSLELIFALGTSELNDFAFFLNDQLIEPLPTTKSGLPKDFKKPEKTTWIDGRKLDYGGGGNYYYDNKPRNVLINLIIPRGNHKLKAAYKVEPTQYYGYAPIKLYQFAYIIAPAHNRAESDGLDLTVYTAPGWKIAIDPNLEGQGEVFKKHFDVIPAEPLTFTTGKPMPDGYYTLGVILGSVFLVCLFGTPILILVLAISTARKGNPLHPAWGLLWSLLWSGLVLATGFAAIFSPDYFYQGIKYGYGDGFLLFFLLVTCFVIFALGSSVWAIGAAIWNSKKAKRTI